MGGEAQTLVTLEELELGLYRQGNAVVVYLNQGSICLHRQRVELMPELSDGGAASIETLRRVAMTVRLNDSRR